MKFRILVYILLIGIIPMVIFNSVLVSYFESTMINQRMEKLQNQCNILKNYFNSASFLNDNTNVDVEEFTQLSSLYDRRIIIVDDNFRVVNDTYNIEQNKMVVSENVINCFKGKNSTVYYEEENYIEYTMALNEEDSTIIDGVMIVSFSTNDIRQSIDIINNASLILILVLTVVILCYSIFTASKMVRPFNKIENIIEMISDGHFEQKLSIGGYTETEQISEAFNQMVGKINKLEESRQEFVSNVSHELKTPITSIKVLADSLIMQDEVAPELYKEFLTDIVEEIDRQSKIINDLLTLVKMDKTASDLNIEQININELVELILKRLRPIAAKRNIELVLESFRPIIAEIDEMKLTLAISNLVENAIKYNVLDGWVHITLNADHKYFYIKVADSGIGIPEEEHEQVFERFYRIDKTRSRDTGGTGLGLSITKNIILMHRGAIKVYSKEGEGTTFTVRIPLNYIS